MKQFKTFLLFLIPLIYFELVFRFAIFGFDFSLPFIYTIPFKIIISFILSILCGLFNLKINKILYTIFLIIFTLWYSLEIIFKKIFDGFFSFATLKIADQAVSFMDTAISQIINNIIYIIILFIPIILLIIFRKKIKLEKNKILINLISLIVTIFMFILSLNIFKTEANELFYKVNNHDLNMNKFGVGISTYLDLKRAVLGFEEEIQIEEPKEPIIEEPKEIVYEYNNLDLNFDKLISTTKDSNVKTISEYVKNDTGTKQNEYTGFFKGKNLIVFMAESFNEIAVSEELTPTLYKLVNSGFSFENFYTPTKSSTLGGEFQILTGLIADGNGLTTWKKGKNYFPYGIGNIFNSLNYKTYAYHNHTYDFQSRNKYLKAIGFNNYMGRYNGLEKRMKFSWPSSDLDMINVTVDDYINSTEPFMVYYVTVSGHFEYTFAGNSMSRRNKSLVNHLNYSEKAKGYLACQIELDKALESLIKKLEEAGQLENTVIALESDHYPYGLSLSEINELSDYKKDKVIEVNRSNLIIWNSEMETVKVSKIASQLDMIPTLYNLFDIDYDSRLFIGKDILSTEPGLVIFENRSWISDYGRYYSANKKFVPNEGIEVDSDYVDRMNKIVSNKINISKLLITKNYYKLITDASKEEVIENTN